MKKIYKNFLLTIIGLVTTGLSYTQSFATFSSSSEGTLEGVNFTIAIAEEHDPGVTNTNLEGEPYSSQKGSWLSTVVKFKPVTDFTCTITFEEAIPNLKFYIADWIYATMEFSMDFVLLSNYDLTATSSNTLTTGVGDGIIEFIDPVTTLTFTRTSGTYNSSHLFTLANGPRLDIDDIFGKTNIVKVFPTPASDFINVAGLKSKESYNIYNALGTVVRSGSVSNNDKIETENLLNGLYFLKLESGNTIKFLKK